MKNWPICGHEKILQSLSEDFAAQNLASVYLFCGPTGVGKWRTAKTFAAFLQNDGKIPADEIDKLNGEKICVDKLWQKDAAEDFEEIARFSNFDQTARQKSKIRTDQITIDDVRAISEKLWQKSDRRKIVAIRSAQRLNTAAANAILKILEEPPARTNFIFTAPATENLPKTLVSRCRIFNFPKISRAKLSEFFAEKLQVFEKNTAEKILKFAAGRAEFVTEFLRDRAALGIWESFAAQISNLPRLSNAEKLNFAAEMSEKTAEEIRIFWEIFFAENAEKIKTGKSSAVSNFTRGLDAVKNLSANGNRKLVFETLFLNLRANYE
jgi:DNA polymerase-3 subunit delta'